MTVGVLEQDAAPVFTDFQQRPTNGQKCLAALLDDPLSLPEIVSSGRKPHLAAGQFEGRRLQGRRLL